MAESTKCAEDAKTLRELNDADSEEILLQIAELTAEEQKIELMEKENQTLVEKVQHLKDELKLRVRTRTNFCCKILFFGLLSIFPRCRLTKKPNYKQTL